jgi:hypothetical protein
MNLSLKHIAYLILSTVLFLCITPPTSAQDLNDGFYTSIYDRIKNEKQEKTVKNVANRMGLSEKDIVAIAQGKSIDTIADVQALALGGEVTREDIDIALRVMSLMSDLENATDEEERARLEKQIAELNARLEPLRAKAKGNVIEILSNYERLVSKFAFEESLVELEISLEEETKALEVFANGDADDVDFGTDSEELVEALNNIAIVKKHVGEVNEGDLDNLTSFDLIRDLNVMDLIIFGTAETKRLSPAGGGGFDFKGARDESEGGDGDIPDDGLKTAGVTGDDDLGADGVPVGELGEGQLGAGGELPNSFDSPLGTKDMHDPEKKLIVDDQGMTISSDGVLECKVGESVDLDYSPEMRLRNLERNETLRDIAALFPDGEIPDDIADGIVDDEDGEVSEEEGVVAGVMSIKSIDAVGINSEEVMEAGEDDEYTEEDCWTSEFDIIACYKLDAGTYGKPKTYKDDNCISCHVNEINKIFSEKLLPYGLKARKNEGLIGGGSYCSDANKMEVGLDIIMVPKPLNFYKDVCYPDPESGEEPPIDEPTRLVNEVQLNYLKAVLTLQEELDTLIKSREKLVEEKRGKTGDEESQYELEIFALDIEIYKKQDEIINLREQNQLILHEWRGLKEDYEEQTGCKYTVGSMKTDNFDKVLEEHDKELLKTIPSTHASEEVDSVVSERILSLEPENIADVYNASEAGVLLRESRYEENKWISENENKLDDLANKASLLAREIREFTTNFRSFKQVMESLRTPKDRSVLKKLSEKQTP